MSFTDFDIISAIYVLAAVVTLLELVRGWRAFIDTAYTLKDDALAARVGFLLLTPFGVLLHEMGHYMVATMFQARDLALNFRVYWGFVSYRGTLPPEADFAVAAMGPLVSAVLGVAALGLALRVPQPFRTALGMFGYSTFALALVVYPAFSFVAGFGDFLSIYSAATPVLSAAAGVVHISLLTAGIVFYRQRQSVPVRAPWSWQPAPLAEAATED